MEETTNALTLAEGGAHGHEAEATLLGLGPEGWVYVGLTIFFLLAIFVAKAPNKIVEALDARIAETVKELDEARALRAEAEALLADAKAKQAQGTKDAEAIVAQAKVEAAEMVSALEASTTELIGRRKKMAEDKIAAAERSAIAELRMQAAAAATAAAANLIAQTHGAEADKAMVNDTIGKLAH
jgi:F-type H+-transporting ATPase subunit b